MTMPYETRTEEQLFIQWTNCRNVLKNPNALHQHNIAKTRIADIEKEWDRRLADAERGNYRTTRPTKGMMARLGYHVGEGQGLSLQARREIVNLVMTERLPFFYSPMYVKEWGEPNTKDRYEKLERFFQGMLGGTYAGDVDRALDEWSKDLEYLEQTYKNQYP